MSEAASRQLAGRYVADPVHSAFGFAVRYQGVSTFRGTLADAAAVLEDGLLEGAAQAESISIRTPQQFRDYVLGPEFLDAEHHPEITFRGSPALEDGGVATIDGALTIKGVTRPVRASGTWTPPEPDAFGTSRGHLYVEAVIDRTDFGMMWEVRLPSGQKALGDDVTLTVDLSLVEGE